MRTLAVDYGKKRIGLAISDPLGVIASPLENVDASYDMKKTVELFIQKLDALKKEGKEVAEIVLGLPLHMDGSESERSEEVRMFKTLLEEKLSIPIHLLDERLTSVQAERSLMQTGFNRKKRTQYVDRVSSVILLQTHLNQKSIGLNDHF